MNKRWILWLLVFMVIGAVGCQGQTSSAGASGGIEKQVNQVDYLGIETPVDKVIPFKPEGHIATNTWFWHTGPVFSPDGTGMYYSRYLKGTTERIQIWETHKKDGVWGEGEGFSIKGLNGDTNCPVFVAGDEALYFYNYNLDKGTIYKATKVGEGWGNPVPMDLKIPKGLTIAWGFSMASNHTIYFELYGSDGKQDHQLYCSVFKDGVYSAPEALTVLNSDTSNTSGPQISADDRMIFFESNRKNGLGEHDIYVSRKDDSGLWQEPINLGPQINSYGEDFGVKLTADGKYLFYLSQRMSDKGYSPYWIRLDAIEALKTTQK